MISVRSWSGWRPRRRCRIGRWCRPEGCCWRATEWPTRRSRAVGGGLGYGAAWRSRFAEQGTTGSGRIAKGRGRKPSLPTGTVEEVVRLTTRERPSTAPRIGARGRWPRGGDRQGRRGQDLGRPQPQAVEGRHVQDQQRSAVRGEARRCGRLYLNPPARAAVFCFDEKTQCQALDRTQPRCQ